MFEAGALFLHVNRLRARAHDSRIQHLPTPSDPLRCGAVREQVRSCEGLIPFHRICLSSPSSWTTYRCTPALTEKGVHLLIIDLHQDLNQF